MSAPIVRPGVAEYVAAVRAELNDLTPDEVDELTGGLEADLDDALEDDPELDPASPVRRFGEPVGYAAELRAAAGLPPRAVQGGRRGVVGLLESAQEATGQIRALPWWPAVHDFAVTVRPAWWVARALVAAVLVTELITGWGGLSPLLLSVLFVVVSVELGRRAMAERAPGWRVAMAVGNVFAALALLPLLASLPPGNSPAAYDESGMVSGSGLWSNGSEVHNIFPYDQQGRPLSGVQLYDGSGQPLQIGEGGRDSTVDSEGTELTPVPAVDAAGQQRWNVFPLWQRPTVTDSGNGPPSSPPAGPRPPSPPPVSPEPLLLGGAVGPASTVTPTAVGSGMTASQAGPTTVPPAATTVPNTSTAAPPRGTTTSTTAPSTTAAPRGTTTAPSTASGTS